MLATTDPPSVLPENHVILLPPLPTPQYHDVDRELSPDKSLIPRLKKEMFIEYHDALIDFLKNLWI